MLRQSVGVLLLKVKIAAWKSMMMTTFAGASPAASNCVVALQTAKASPSYLVARFFPTQGKPCHHQTWKHQTRQTHATPAPFVSARKRMEGSERYRAVGRIEAGQTITDVALFFDIHHSVISRLWNNSKPHRQWS
ncbi:hypothetical protein TNCV_2660451 [Trichonephila clavipes]|uniref:Uncharacterized protein n=1 Tax=Trichonephila clavipes TaxID=2585209 RepID=A0A8X6V0H4_TRICX|nr:hypothetical protein TNCV_2660451 [Trichonephila clavipes]